MESNLVRSILIPTSIENSCFNSDNAVSSSTCCKIFESNSEASTEIPKKYMEASCSQNVPFNTKFNSTPENEKSCLIVDKKEERQRNIDNTADLMSTNSVSVLKEAKEKLPNWSCALLTKMGYEGGPLGLRGEGIMQPMAPPLNVVNRAGLGYRLVNHKKNKVPLKQRIINKNRRNIIPNVKHLPHPKPTVPAALLHPPPPMTIPLFSNVPPAQINVNTGKVKRPKKGDAFKLSVLRAAVNLMSTEQVAIGVPYTRKKYKKVAIIKDLLEMVNKECDLCTLAEEEAILANKVKSLMVYSVWKIELSEFAHNRLLILKKVPSKSMDPIIIDPITLEDRLSNGNHLMHTVFITNQQLNYYVNNVSIPNFNNYPQACTFSLAFRLIVLDEIRKFSRSDQTILRLHLCAAVDKRESEFVNSLIGQASWRPNFESEIENEMYNDIECEMLKHKLCLDIEQTRQRILIVRKLPNNLKNRRMARERLIQRCADNNASNHGANTFITNDNSDNVTKVTAKSNDNTPNIHIFNEIDDASNDSVKTIVLDYNKNNDNKSDNLDAKYNELSMADDDEVILMERVYEMIEVSDEEIDRPKNLSTTGQIDSIVVPKEATAKEEPQIPVTGQLDSIAVKKDADVN